MKKLYLLLIACMTMTVLPATAQKHSRDTKMSNPVIHATPFKPSHDNLATLILRNEMQPLQWIQDSTYYSSWNISSSNWDLYEKGFRTFYPNGQLQADSYIEYDALLLTWHNSYRYVYFYYPSGSYEITGTQGWDNSLSAWKELTHYHYNSSGKVDTSFSKIYDLTHHRYNSGTQTIYAYDGNGKNVETVNQHLDTATSAWVNQFRYQYTFDSGNHLTETIYQTWDTGLSSWVNSIKSDYTYDVNGFMTGVLEYSWNGSGSTWENLMRGTYTNNASGYALTYLHETWNSGLTTWEDSERETWQYNVNNQKTQYLDEDWDDVQLMWKNYSSRSYSYYSNGEQDEYYEYYWNPLLLLFMETSYFKSDSLGHSVVYSSKSIDWTTYVYTGGYKYTYSYNTFNLTDTIFEEELNPSTLAWYDYSRRLDTYDASQNLITEIDQNYDTLGLVWTNTYKQEHFYTFISGIQETGKTSDYCFYSNPLEAGTTIVCPNLTDGRNYLVSLNDMQGRCVYTKNISSGESFTLPSTLAPGMYLMQIVSEGKMLACGKVIVR